MVTISTKLSSKSARVTITRRLELPKADPLPALTLESPSQMSFDMGGIDPKSDVARDIIKAFENGLKLDLDIRTRKADALHIKEWKQAAAFVGDDKNAGKVEAFAKKFEAKVVKDWNAFNARQMKLSAEGTFDSVVQSVFKKHKEKGKTPKFSFGAEELKAERVGMLGSILGALGVSLGTGGGAALLAGGIAGVATLMKGYNSAWTFNQKRMGDAQSNLADLKRGLDSAKSTLDKLAPAVDRLKQHKSQIEAGLVEGASNLRKARSELQRLEALARGDAAVKEGKVIKEAAQRTEKLEKSIAALKTAAARSDEIAARIAKAQTAVDDAASAITVERNRWDKIMDAYNKVGQDSDTAMGAVEKLVGAFK